MLGVSSWSCTSRRKATSLVVALVLVALLTAGVLIFAGCESEQQAKEKEFQANWTKIVEAFQAQVAKDDQKGQALVNKNDLAGVIRLVKARIASVDNTLSELLALYPPDSLRKLQGLSVYYLITLEDRLRAQNAVYEALLSGTPTQDLQTVLNQAVTRSEIIARELTIELQKDGIKLKAPSTTPQAPPPPPSSSPALTPSTSPAK